MFTEIFNKEENILSKESKEKLLEEMKILSGDEIMFKRFRRKSTWKLEKESEMRERKKCNRKRI